MGGIHPTAIIAPGARLSAEVKIGPYCVIGPEVALGRAVELLAHVVIEGRTEIGEGTVVHQFATLGGPPQHLRYAGEPTELQVGRNCRIREYVTINRGTAMGGGRTVIGSDGFFMTGVHIAHDCHIGANVIMANQATLGGHVSVGDHVVIGGLSAVHQHVRIGAHAMIGGMTPCAEDVVPFGMVVGNPAHLSGLNLVGLKRRGFDRKAILTLRAIYRALFEGPGTFAERTERTVAKYADEPLAQPVLDFVRGGKARSLCKPGERHGRH
jgi:UDP-N-acetylglucosamine acyltransferase